MTAGQKIMERPIDCFRSFHSSAGMDVYRRLDNDQTVLRSIIAGRPYDANSLHYYELEISYGYDNDGHSLWECVFRHHDVELVDEYAALYHAGRSVRRIAVRRFNPGFNSGTVINERLYVAPDRYHGIQKLNGWHL